MSVFSREADGRLARSPIYKKVREHFGLENDFDVVEIVLRDIFPYRDKVAALQKLALQAAEEGDETMISLYGQAAQELSLLIKGVKEQLGMGRRKGSRILLRRSVSRRKICASGISKGA